MQIVNNMTGYVSSQRDRELVVVDLSSDKPAVTGRIALNGNPNRIITNKAQTRLYVAVDNADAVAVINTADISIVESIETIAPAPRRRGAG